jgi:hypothetical protein
LAKKIKKDATFDNLIIISITNQIEVTLAPKVNLGFENELLGMAKKLRVIKISYHKIIDEIQYQKKI